MSLLALYELYIEVVYRSCMRRREERPSPLRVSLPSPYDLYVGIVCEGERLSILRVSLPSPYDLYIGAV